MSAMRRLVRGLADAALQLTLPFLDGPASPPRTTRAGARVARLEGQFVEYTLRRSRRRTIGLVVDDRGLTVTVPRWVSQAEIDAALDERARWVLRKLAEWREHAARRERIAVRWEDGASLPFLGETLTLRIEPSHAGAACRDGATLRLALPTGAGSEQIRDSVQGWLQRQARRVFEERCAHFAPRLGVQVRRIGLSSATTRWGSASADGSIRLHWRLVHFAPSVIDYVVTHELAHLREMNHSPAFWEVVRSVIPDYRHALSSLRQQVLPAFD